MAFLRRPQFGSVVRRANFGGRLRRAMFGGPTSAAFPSTGVLDSFNRANEGPPPSASWSNVDGFTGLSVIGNVCGGTVSDCLSTWNTSFNANQENYVKLTTPPLNGQAIRLMVRQLEATLFRDCYYAEFISNTPAAGTLRFWKRLTITDTQIGADITLSADLSTQQLGIRVVGSTITAWMDGVQLGSRTDSDVAGAGRLMVYCTDSTTRFDNFGGGAV